MDSPDISCLVVIEMNTYERPCNCVLATDAAESKWWSSPRAPRTWISVHVSYGLFLSDHRILDMQETELVVLPAIMTQGLRGPTYWHLRACLRAGMEPNEVEAIHKVIEAVAAHGGRTLDT
ncbi:hypothetical protein B0T16DRAFT_462883 [Cercophora newfieldiana]|uniref:Uncharacterized protein n=1 Tax=Cercophora newfieldiana TaxID=92897 RepID=A0AA39XS18_9PEZI|nr:hypothetical protein B0T16DRAFT_462883 [Cercophora newfieldiana]